MLCKQTVQYIYNTYKAKRVKSTYFASKIILIRLSLTTLLFRIIYSMTLLYAFLMKCVSNQVNLETLNIISARWHSILFTLKTPSNL